MSAACDMCGAPCDSDGSVQGLCASCTKVYKKVLAAQEADNSSKPYEGPLTDGTHVRIDWHDDENAYVGRLTMREPNGLHRRVTKFAVHEDMETVLHSLMIAARLFK